MQAVQVENEGAPQADLQPRDALATTGKSKLSVRKASVLVLLVAFIIFLIVDYTSTRAVASTLESFLDWVELNVAAGAVTFAAVYAVSTVLFVPGSLLTLGAGYVFARAVGQGAGIALGVLVVWAGANVGATAAFLLGRYVLRDAAGAWYRKFRIMEAVDSAVAEQGLKIVTLLRLSPIVPFTLLNYIMGLTSVGLHEYVVGTVVGIVPGTAAFVFIGTTLQSIGGGEVSEEDEEDSTAAKVKLAVLIVGALATIVAVVVVSKFARHELQKHLAVMDAGEAEVLKDDEGDESVSDSVAVAVTHKPDQPLSTL